MPFLPGNTLGKGRLAGVPNKNNEVRAYLKGKGIDAIGLFLKEWDAGRNSNHMEAARLMLQFIEYVYPKQKAIDVTITEEQAILKLKEAIDVAGKDISIPDQLLLGSEDEEESGPRFQKEES